jgi:hypothetical protein
VINTLVSEFAKRNTRVTYNAVDDRSYNELLELKRQEIEEVLLFEAEQKLVLKLSEMGMPMDSEEFKQATSKENLRSLPEIQDFYSKSYRSNIEEWAEHQHRVDVERFKMD